MKNFDDAPLPLRRFESDRGGGNYKSEKFIAKSSKFIQGTFLNNLGSKIYHPNFKFIVGDVEVVITFFDINTINVDALIIPYTSSYENKTVKRLSKMISTNIQ